MDRRFYFVASFLIIVLIVGIFLITLPTPKTKVTRTKTEPTKLAVVQPSPAVLSVAAYACQKDRTPLEVLKDLAQVKTEGSGSAQIVTLINGSSEPGRRWIYSVDEKVATTSAQNFKCRGEEVIRWELKSL